ncbi:uncharacterized protein LAESUDRAFT_764774 [Laetiporus sulphureus 93-53]|uniref:Uncharacterized protein n=1 Tax=Laetiporus sulphureus 93-53 TaxID=1314785 RepID=A0A165B4Q0_9APHY|nr:uncharacterized protein LAESUDRAFT_764774 [Laetiporus sulphureus 93-53]KZT00232.1 hypothetical protein LAESUDRAFT_764774 [Laetiporus sulphureus 93-53]
MSALGTQPVTISDVDMEASGVEPIAPPQSNATVPPTPTAPPTRASLVEEQDMTMVRFNGLLRHITNNIKSLNGTIQPLIQDANSTTFVDNFAQVICVEAIKIFEHFLTDMAPFQFHDYDNKLPELSIPPSSHQCHDTTLPASIDLQAAVAKAMEDGVCMANMAITTRLTAIEAQLARNWLPPPLPPPKLNGLQQPSAMPAGRKCTEGSNVAATAQPTTQAHAGPTMAQVAAKPHEKSYVLLITFTQHTSIEEGRSMPQWYAKINTCLCETPAWAKLSVVPRASSPAPGPRKLATVLQDFHPLAPVMKLFIPSCPLRHLDTDVMLTEEEILVELSCNSMFSSVHFNGLPAFIIPSEQ